jgi:hypothetical protein
MKMRKATQSYEAWLARHTPLLEADIALKHQRMNEHPFSFLRATFYRWMQRWPEVCLELAKAPQVLAVGDLHVENFGTWRDVEGRLVWGINDLDEAYALPYTVDLVRLAASAHLAVAIEHLAVRPEGACEAILQGYVKGIEAGGRPFVLAEDHKGLREMASGELRDPVRFWKKMDALPTLQQPVPASAREALEHLLPEPGLAYRVAHRVAGLGSLGRQRYVALADWRGGKVAREAKALAPSASVWATEGKGPAEILYQTLLSCAVRCRDPFVQLRGHWIVRRLAPDCSRIELASFPKEGDQTRLLEAMGQETANLHLGSKKAMPEVRRDLKRRRPNWLHLAAGRMVEATTEDWEEWKKAPAD